MGPLKLYVRTLAVKPKLRSWCGLLKRLLPLRAHCTTSRELVLATMTTSIRLGVFEDPEFEGALACLEPLFDCCIAASYGASSQNLECAKKCLDKWQREIAQITDYGVLYSLLHAPQSSWLEMQKELIAAAKGSRVAKVLLSQQLKHGTTAIVQQTIAACIADKKGGDIDMQFVSSAVDLAVANELAVTSKACITTSRTRNVAFLGVPRDMKMKGAEEEGHVRCGGYVKEQLLADNRMDKLPWEYPLRPNPVQIAPKNNVDEAVLEHYSAPRAELADALTKYNITGSLDWSLLPTSAKMALERSEVSIALELTTAELMGGDVGHKLLSEAIMGELATPSKPKTPVETMQRLELIQRSPTVPFCSKTSIDLLTTCVNVFKAIAGGKQPGEEVLTGIDILGSVRASLPYTIWHDAVDSQRVFGADAVICKVAAMSPGVSIREVDALLSYSFLCNDSTIQALNELKTDAVASASLEEGAEQARMQATVTEHVAVRVKPAPKKSGKTSPAASSTGGAAAAKASGSKKPLKRKAADLFE